ncbi:MAG: hypothetical protein AB1540_10730 [Bdellovibrionota bacterium]
MIIGGMRIFLLLAVLFVSTNSAHAGWFGDLFKKSGKTAPNSVPEVTITSGNTCENNLTPPPSAGASKEISAHSEAHDAHVSDLIKAHEWAKELRASRQQGTYTSDLVKAYERAQEFEAARQKEDPRKREHELEEDAPRPKGIISAETQAKIVAYRLHQERYTPIRQYELALKAAIESLPLEKKFDPTWIGPMGFPHIKQGGGHAMLAQLLEMPMLRMALHLRLRGLDMVAEELIMRFFEPSKNSVAFQTMTPEAIEQHLTLRAELHKEVSRAINKLSNIVELQEAFVSLVHREVHLDEVFVKNEIASKTQIPQVRSEGTEMLPLFRFRPQQLHAARLVLQYGNLYPGAKVLEVGFGTLAIGKALQTVAQNAGLSIEYVGVDPAPVSKRSAPELSGMKIFTDQFPGSSMTSIGITQAGPYDVIFAVDVFKPKEYVDGPAFQVRGDRIEFLRELRKKLKPGGIFLTISDHGAPMLFKASELGHLMNRPSTGRDAGFIIERHQYNDFVQLRFSEAEHRLFPETSNHQTLGRMSLSIMRNPGINEAQLAHVLKTEKELAEELFPQKYEQSTEGGSSPAAANPTGEVSSETTTEDLQ